MGREKKPPGRAPCGSSCDCRLGLVRFRHIVKKTRVAKPPQVAIARGRVDQTNNNADIEHSTNCPEHSSTKRSVKLAGKSTSVSLEAPFWAALKEIAVVQVPTVPALIAAVDAARSSQNLSSALRSFVRQHYRERAMLAASWRRSHLTSSRSGDYPGTIGDV